MWIILFDTVLDDYSPIVWLHLIAEKCEVVGILHDLFATVKTQFNKTVKIVQSDNGTEFVCL